MLRVRRAANVGAPATVGRQREGEKIGKQEDCDLSGSTTLTVSYSGREPLRREREKQLESDRGGIDPRARGRHKEPSRRKGDVPLGYSGRTALRREQCDMLPESQNVGAD
jgi:hypothetical protein